MREAGREPAGAAGGRRGRGRRGRGLGAVPRRAEEGLPAARGGPPPGSRRRARPAAARWDARSPPARRKTRPATRRPDPEYRRKARRPCGGAGLRLCTFLCYHSCK